MKRVVMNETGRLTIPAEARRELGIEGEAEFELEVEAGADALVLRPVVLLRREDAWAYTPEHRKQLARAHRDSREDRVKQLSEEELAKLAD